MPFGERIIVKELDHAAPRWLFPTRLSQAMALFETLR